MLNQVTIHFYLSNILQVKSIVKFVLILFGFSLLLSPIQSEGNKETEDDTKSALKQKTITLPSSFQFGGFIDSYYAYNRNLPKDTERNYTTQAVRNGEFNINLAYLDAKVEEKKYRGRLAFQWGTSVNANYAAEVTTEKYSNQASVKNIQEAYTGFKLGKDTWIDMGIFLVILGMSLGFHIKM